MNPREREELLRLVTTGELQPKSERVMRAVRLDEAFARELEELLGARRRLERVTDQARAVMADAADLEAVPGTQVVRDYVRARVEQERSKRIRRAWSVYGSLAAAVLAFFLYLAVGRQERADEDFPLGSGALRCVSPCGPVEQFDVFRWETELVGGRFEILILGEDGAELDRAEVRGREWFPESERLSSWPSRIEWELTWFDSTDRPVESLSVQAWLRR